MTVEIYEPNIAVGTMGSPCELHNGDMVEFYSRDENKDENGRWLGVPMWTMCIKALHGKLSWLFITSCQQHPQRFFVIDLRRNPPDFVFMDYKKAPPPSSFMGWCREHKCTWTRIWCPEETTRFVVRMGSVLNLEWA